MSRKKIKRKTKISACYIVKNEAKNLEHSIKSLRKSIDEIIVVDTGSTDDTVAIAEKLGAKVFFDKWEDDFSKPRNVALKNVSGDWILFLDADEYLSDGSSKNLRAIIERAEVVKKTALALHLVNIDVDNDNKFLGEDYVMRLFKKRIGLHYVGKIHEELRVGENKLNNTAAIPKEIFTIYHTGYSESLNKNKAERNLKMLLTELEETNEPQRIYHYIAECYRGLDDLENAEKFSLMNIESNNSQRISVCGSYRILLNILSQKPERLEERFQYSRDAIEKFPALPEFYAELAECYAMRDDYPKAIETMQTALKKFKNYSAIEPTTFNAEVVKFAESRIKKWYDVLL